MLTKEEFLILRDHISKRCIVLSPSCAVIRLKTVLNLLEQFSEEESKEVVKDENK